MRTVYLRGKKHKLDPAQAIGEGGEAEVFAIGGGLALKVYKGPEHADYAASPEAQAAARARLLLRAPKLREFPRVVPPGVIAPSELATDRSGREVLGYAMPLVAGAEPLARYAEPGFRARGVPHADAVRVLCALHELLGATHRAGIVVGDLNDQNVLVRVDGLRPFLIDCDSYQFGRYLCDVYTERFLDPLLCDPGVGLLEPARPFSEASDWYAFTAMVMQSLLFVGPYGGVYRPHHRAAAPAASARPLYRITVFHPEVVYPRPALPCDTLPDDLLQHLHLVFEKDLRVPFPRRLLEALAWSRCPLCGLEHARAVCPRCAQAPTSRTSELVSVRGEVTARVLVRGRGTLCAVALDEDGTLRWLAHEAGAFAREDGRVVLRAPLSPRLRFRLQRGTTLVGEPGRLRVLGAGPAQDLGVDAADGVAAFDASARHRFWVEGGQLRRDGLLGAEVVGDVLAGQTRIFVGPGFGLGFYRAGGLFVAFVFDGERRGLNDGVRLPPIGGRLLAAHATLSASRAWLFLALERAGRVVHRSAVVGRDGALLAVTEAARDDGSWLGSAGALHGACAVGDALFAPTDAGLVRVELDAAAHRVAKVRDFPDTAPFVHEGSRLLAGATGLFVVGEHEIVQLTLSPRR